MLARRWHLSSKYYFTLLFVSFLVHISLSAISQASFSQGIIAWPVAKLLEWSLGPHHGIIYRRAELKELIAMHSTVGQLGGDLRSDTVTIIGATLDLQEKTAKQVSKPSCIHLSYPPIDIANHSTIGNDKDRQRLYVVEGR